MTFWKSLFGPKDDIHEAAYTGDLEKLRAILKNKPRLVFRKDKNGYTPLHAAASAEYLGHPGVVEFLLAHGADVNARDNDGNTPLHFAAIRGLTEVTQLLLAHGADVNAKAANGRTPLQVAANFGCTAAAELMCRLGGHE